MIEGWTEFRIVINNTKKNFFSFCPNPTGKRIRPKTNAHPHSMIITSNTNRKAFIIVLMLWKDQTIAEIFAPFVINLWLSKCQFFFSFQLLSIYSRRTLCIFCNVQLNDVINSVLATLHKEKFKWLLFLIFPSSTWRSIHEDDNDHK